MLQATHHPQPTSPMLRAPRSTPRKRSAFTLIELLIVIAIIAILAGLGFAGVNGALKTARKAEVRGMANQVKLALNSYYGEYGVWPPNVTKTDSRFVETMTGQRTNENRRAIRFLEVPKKFSSDGAIVTPPRFYEGDRKQFSVVIDTNYDGRINIPGQGEVDGSIAVYVADPDSANKFIGTW